VESTPLGMAIDRLVAHQILATSVANIVPL